MKINHREMSLTPWIDPKGDHDYTFLPATLYDAAEREGCDMKWFKRQEPIPTSPPKKHRDQRMCSGKESVCLPGKGGKCVACCDDD